MRRQVLSQVQPEGVRDAPLAWTHLDLHGLVRGQGLQDRGYGDVAAQVTVKLAELVQRAGFREQYNPLTGQGYGRKLSVGPRSWPTYFLIIKPLAFNLPFHFDLTNLRYFSFNGRKMI